MTTHETKLVKEAVARTLSEIGERAAPGGQDSWRGSWREGVSAEEALEIKEIVRNFPTVIRLRKRLKSVA